MWKLSIFALICCFSFLQLIEAFEGIPGLYCGLESCYDVLGATRETSRDELTRLYRSLARKYHPDRFFKEDEKAAATEKFRLIATAYEVLKDEESRKDYNDMLDDPEQYYRHYYRYYRRVYGTKVDSRWVIIGTITCISIYQYFMMNSRYREALDYCCSKSQYIFKAQEIAKQRGLLQDKKSSKSSSGVKKGRHKSKEEKREEEKAIIRQIIADNMDIRGVARPDITKILWIQLFMLPITLYKHIAWHIRWIYLFDIKREPYGRDEKIYLISKHLGCHQEQLELGGHIDFFLKQELWMKDKADSWLKKKEEERQERLATSSKFKRERRFIKKNGPSQISFADD